MAVRSFHVISLCSGYAGLELAIGLVVRGSRTVCYVEREAFAACVLATRMEEGCLDPAPIWSDLRTFDGRPWRGIVSCVAAGIPCQPHSQAGKRKHEDDERYLWPDFLRVVRECESPLFFLENVGGFSRMLPILDRDCWAHGYQAIAASFTALEVGAPHERLRGFVLGWRLGDDGGRASLDVLRGALADDDDARQRGVGSSGVLDGERQAFGDDADGCGGQAVADDDDKPLREQSGRSGRSGGTDPAVAGVARQDVGDTDISRRDEWTGSEPEARRRHEPPNGSNEFSLFPPWRDRRLWQNVPEDLQPPFPRVDDGAPAALDLGDTEHRLRLSGGGVVPLEGAFAFRALALAALGALGGERP